MGFALVILLGSPIIFSNDRPDPIFLGVHNLYQLTSILHNSCRVAAYSTNPSYCGPFCSLFSPKMHNLIRGLQNDLYSNKIMWNLHLQEIQTSTFDYDNYYDENTNDNYDKSSINDLLVKYENLSIRV